MTEFLLNFNSYFEKILFNSEQALLKFFDFMFLASPFIITVICSLVLLFTLYLVVLKCIYSISERRAFKKYFKEHWEKPETK